MERSFKRLRFVPVRKFTPGIICSIVLMLIMLAIFSVASAGLTRTIAVFSAESRAIMVMDNTMERLGALPGFDDATVEKIFKDEFMAAGFDPGCFAWCSSVVSGRMLLRISLQQESEQRVLAEVTVVCPKKQQSR